MKKICFINYSNNNYPYKLTKDNSNKWGDVEATRIIDEADYFIVIEEAPKELLEKLPKDRTICFPSEPPSLRKVKDYEKYDFKYVFTYENHHHIFEALFFIGGDYQFYNNLEIPYKTKLCSIVISNKELTYGHKLRTLFIKYFCNKYPGMLDVYGTGWKYELGSSYKGYLHKGNNEGLPTKYDGLINYKYSLVMENCSINNYFTEKITDAYLCWCMPIYYGCKNIHEYFPEDSYYLINPYDDDALEKLVEIINRPITEKNIAAIKIARNLCLNNYNVWNCVNNIIKDKEYEN
jgi:hypothetical protein